MRIKKYLKNLWNDLVNDESGQLYDPYSLARPYAPKPKAWWETGGAVEDWWKKTQKAKTPSGKYIFPQPSTPTGSLTTVNIPYIAPKQPVKPTYTPFTYTGPIGQTPPIEGTPPTISDVMTQPRVEQPVTREVTGGAQFPLMGYPAMPDLTAGLSAEDLARLESESGMLAELEFGPAFSQLEKNLIESKRVATEEKEEAVPIYEKSMRDTAATVANAIAGWAQKLNQIGMLRSGAYGRGISRLETAGVAERGGLQKALNERLENISTREADYERDVLDLRAGLEKEKGLRQSTSFERMKREELVYQRDTRQMAFANEVQRTTFMNTMNQMIWQRDMSEKQLNASLEAQSIENQLLKSRISSLYGAGAEGVEVEGVGKITPEQAFEWGFVPKGQYYESELEEFMKVLETLGLRGGAGATTGGVTYGTKSPTTGAIEPWSYQR